MNKENIKLAVKELKQKFDNTKEIKDPELKRHAINLIRIGYNPQILRAFWCLKYCDFNSVKKQKTNLLKYYMHNFDWMHFSEAVILIEQIMQPRTAFGAVPDNKITPAFTLTPTSINNMAYMDKISLDKSLANFSVNLHIYSNDSKEKILEFINDYWDCIQEAFDISEYNRGRKASISSETYEIRKIIAQYLFFSNQYSTTEIMTIMDLVLESDNFTEQNKLTKQKTALMRNLETDWFSEVAKQIKNSTHSKSNFNLEFDEENKKFVIA